MKLANLIRMRSLRGGRMCHGVKKIVKNPFDLPSSSRDHFTVRFDTSPLGGRIYRRNFLLLNEPILVRAAFPKCETFWRDGRSVEFSISVIVSVIPMA